ncbi:hypothetical protein [Methanoculleus sp.]|uniref:hypothetical protein n=1 Tax=Methanoculleus sp. TaxID=90427 RepID=UPI0025F9A9C9|nr:hypothetical protein [Methanoculleus sp.]
MNDENRLKQLCNDAPGWVTTILPLVSAAAGGLVLWATWFFYGDLYPSGFTWHNWIQPALMVIGGLLALAAAGLLVMRRPGGWDLLWAAITMIPVILALRLVIVVILAVGHVSSAVLDGSLVDRLGSISPASIAVTVVILAAIGIASLLGKADETPEDNS